MSRFTKFMSGGPARVLGAVGVLGLGLLVGACASGRERELAMRTDHGVGAEWSPGVEAEAGLERRVVAGINAFRAREGRAGMLRNEGLDRLARGHARAMLRRRQMSHEGFGGRVEAGRREDRLEGMAENVAWGYGVEEHELAAHLVDGWIGSQGHRANLLRDNEAMGVAVVRGDDGSYWAVEISARRAE